MRRALPPRPPQQPKHRHHRGKANRARIGLGIMYTAFVLIQFLWLDAIPTERRNLVMANIISSVIWYTALLIAIAMRKSWARLILLFLQALSVVACLILIPDILDMPGVLTILLITTAFYAISFGWLLYSRDVRRLVGRNYE